MMHRQRTVFVLAAAVLSLTAVTVALAASLLDDGDKTPDRASPSTAELATPTQAPSPTLEAEQPDGIPDDIWARLELLPEKLRDDLLQRFDSGWLALPEIETVIEEFENRDQSVRVGTVIKATDEMLSLEVYTTGEQAEVQLDNETVLRRGHEDITAADLEPDELVMVLSRDGGKTAFAVSAFGVGAP